MNSGDVTVALFGDCATHIAAGKYKHTRAVGLTNWISIVSPSTDNFMRLTQEKLNETSLTNYEKRICLLNSNKKFMEYLLEEKADYLVIDCNDCRKGLIYDDALDGERSYITDNRYLDDFYKCMEIMFGTRGRCVLSTDVERSEYAKAVEIICNQIKKVYKPEQVVLNKHYYVGEYIDDKGMHRCIRIKDDESDKTLDLIKYIESLVERHMPGCHIIEFPDNVILDPEHIFGICSLHYHPLYYDYVIEALEIIFHSLSEEKFFLNQLHRSYSMRFQMMKMKMLHEFQTRKLEDEIDNVISLSDRCIPLAENVDVSRMLHAQDNIYSYLDILYLLRDEIIILMATKDTSGGNVTFGCHVTSESDEHNAVVSKLKRLGFKNFPAKLWWMYSGIIFKGVILVDCAADEVEKPVMVEQLIGDSKIQIRSESFNKGNKAVININGRDYAKNRRGLNIVVCSATDGTVLDSVSYDSFIMDCFYRSDNT